MKICVISDTHIPDRYEELPEKLIRDLKSADLVIHAGDLTAVSTLKRLKKINKSFLAVCGNLDEISLRSLLKEKEIISCEGFRVGVMHGCGAPDTVFAQVRRVFEKEGLDLVIFGHTHAPLCERVEGTIYLNPGSPTDTVFAAVNSYGVVDIGKSIQAKVITI